MKKFEEVEPNDLGLYKIMVGWLSIPYAHNWYCLLTMNDLEESIQAEGQNEYCIPYS